MIEIIRDANVQMQNTGTDAVKNAAKQRAPGVDRNLGWKLHTTLKSRLSIEEAALEVGLKVRMQNAKVIYEVVDQAAFENFAERVSAVINPLQGEAILKNSNNQSFMTTIMESFINPRDILETNSKTASIFDILDLVETLDSNQIGFKYGSAYAEGKQLTAYAGSLEERDRIIAIVEQAMGDRLENSSDQMKILSSAESNLEKVNHQISDNFTGRFTTEYAQVDSSGNLDITTSKGGEWLTEKQDSAGRGRVTGEVSNDELRRLGELVDDHPVMGELLHGKPGYDSPYATIEDIIEARGHTVPTNVARDSSVPPPKGAPSNAGTPPPSGATGSSASQAAAASSVPPATGSAANNVPPTPTTGAPTPVAQAAAASSVPPATGSAANAAAPASSAATIGTPAAKISTSTAQAQAQAQASSNTQATSSTQRQTTQARVSSTPAASAVTAPSAGSTGAPVRGTQSLLKAGRGLSASVASGTKGYGNLKVLGAGLLVGIGAQKIASNQRENSRERIHY
jgi:hypothetical protein